MMMMMMMIIIIKASNKWLTNADLFAETEDFLTAIRDQVIVTRNYKKYTLAVRKVSERSKYPAIAST